MRLVPAAAVGIFNGAMLLALSGCFGPQPYGYPQPGYYQQPIQTLEPGGTYVPGSGTYAPGSTIQSTPPSGSFTPMDGGDAPTYSGSSGTSRSQSPVVPNPPGSSPFYGEASGSQFQDPTPSQQYNPPAASSPTNPFGSTPPAGAQEIKFEGYQPPALLEVHNGPRLVPAMTVAYEPEAQDDASLSIAAHHTARVTSETEPTFDHDRQSYTWLRGVMSFDETDGSWSIVYDDIPESDDPYAGFLTVLDHPAFDDMRDGAEVTLFGAVDPVLTDSTGRPRYVVSRVVPVEG